MRVVGGFLTLSQKDTIKFAIISHPVIFFLLFCNNTCFLRGLCFVAAFFVATQFFYTLSFINMLIAVIFVVMYMLCVDEYYRVNVLRWTGIDLIIGGMFQCLMAIYLIEYMLLS